MLIILSLCLFAVASGAACTTVPSATCSEIIPTLALDADGLVSVTVEAMNVTVTLGPELECTPQSTSVTPTQYACADITTGNQVRQVDIAARNPVDVHFCPCPVKVVDNLAPQAKCKAAAINVNANGIATITSADINDASSDNCAIQTYRVEPPTLGCQNLGANTVKLTVEDASQNSDSCDAVVTVSDITAPTVTCKPDFTVRNAIVFQESDLIVSATDNCGTPVITWSPSGNDCNDLEAPQVVTVTATDASGNTASCFVSVTCTAMTTVTTTAPEMTTPIITTPVTPDGCFDACAYRSVTATTTALTVANNGGGIVSLVRVEGTLSNATFVSVAGGDATCTNTASSFSCIVSSIESSTEIAYALTWTNETNPTLSATAGGCPSQHFVLV